MSAVLIGVAGIFVLALGLALYFLFGQKNCTKITQEGKCKAPCKWDLYGNKCIDKNTTPTDAPASVPDVAEATAAMGEVEAPVGTPAPSSFSAAGYTEFDKFKVKKGSTCANESNECEVKCNYEPSCIGFTISTNNGKCCLLESVSDMGYEEESQVHMKTPEGYSIEKLGDREGGMLAAYTDKTYAECVSACNKKRGCVGISYSSEGCEIKGETGLASVYTDTGKQFIKNNTVVPLPTGRYIKLTHTVAYDANAPGNTDDINKIINVAELEVYDVENNLISSNLPVTGSSEYSSTHKLANLTDGDKTNFAHTKGRTEDEMDYMQIDLGSEKTIKKIVLTNRTSCCKDRIIGCKIMILGNDEAVVDETPIIASTKDEYTFDFSDNVWT